MPGLAEFGVPAYGDWLEEARRCRAQCALFDFSFMCRARLRGKAARRALERIQSRPLTGMLPGEIRYGLCLDSEGAVLSDITVWCSGADDFDLYSGTLTDIQRARGLSTAGVAVEDLTENTRVYAIQGPDTLAAMAPLADIQALQGIGFFRHREVVVGGVACRVGRLGYTGEKGFEIIPQDPADAANLYDALAERAPPAGMLAADMLRIEAGYLLFTNDCRLGCGPAALGLARFDGAPQQSPPYRRVFFHVDESVTVLPCGAPETLKPPVPGTIAVTSVTPSIALGGSVGMGLIHADDPADALRATMVSVDTPVVAGARPFYDPDKSIARGDWRS